MADTDTEIMERWKAIEKVQRSLDAGRLPRGYADATACRRDLDNRRYAVRRSWDEIIERKRRGELTDPSRIEPIESAVTGFARLAGMPIKVTRSEAGRSADYIPKAWVVLVTYAGKLAEHDEDRWTRFTEKLDDELNAFRSILWGHSGNGYGYDQDEVPPAWWTDNLRARQEGRQPADARVGTADDPYRRRLRMYMIDCDVWQGPPPER